MKENCSFPRKEEMRFRTAENENKKRNENERPDFLK